MAASAATDELLAKAGDLHFDADAVSARVERVLADPLYWFPVRHHSPAVARHLERVIETRRPEVIFIEGPFEANDLIPHVVDPQTKPPVAIYSSYRDDSNVLGLAGICSPSVDIPARFSCWYPLVAYSPEYVAMQAAQRIGAKVVFIDLPHYSQIPARRQAAGGELPESGDGSGTDKPAPPPVGGNRPEQLQAEDDRLIVESGFYQALARTAGYRSWPEAWDSLFELRALDEDTEAFRRELAAFCAAARATTPEARVKSDGTLERERFMLRTIRQTLAALSMAPEKALVVCGGFHLFYDRDDAQPPPEAPPGTVYTSVVPYSYFRISELSGYGAGNRAPQYYQSCWDAWRGGRADELLAEHIVAVLSRARREGEVLSSADAIAVSQHARMLARLRGRMQPVLDDIHDALFTCCCKGDPSDEGVNLRKALDAVDVGTRLGRVTPALGRLPILNDFYGIMEALKLGEVMGKEKRLALQLDKRQPDDARRSAFFHRLTFLGIPVCTLRDASTTELASGTIFREQWELRWSPKVEAELVERNLYGDTIEAASLARLQEEMAKQDVHAGAACGRLVAAINMDLPEALQRADEACGNAIDNDARFVSLCQALSHLSVIDRYATFRGLSRDRLNDLIVRCYDRACFALLDVANAPEEQQMPVVEGLKLLAEVVLREEATRGLDRALFAQHVRTTAAQSHVPFLRGALLGMLAELREIPADEMAGEVAALAKAPADQMVMAGDLLDGMMAVSRTSIMLGADSLIAAIDELLRAADWDAFLTMAPRMRGAFERLHARDVDSLAECVARRYGLAEGESLTELRTSVGAAALFARLDAEVARILQQWEM